MVWLMLAAVCAGLLPDMAETMLEAASLSAVLSEVHWHAVRASIIEASIIVKAFFFISFPFFMYFRLFGYNIMAQNVDIFNKVYFYILLIVLNNKLAGQPLIFPRHTCDFML